MILRMRGLYKESIKKKGGKRFDLGGGPSSR